MKFRKIAFITIGCKVNYYDTQAMAGLFRDKGYEITDFDDFADVYVINTCTVTSFGDKKSRQAIRRAKRKNPEAVVVAAGCYTQTRPDEVSEIEGVNILIGTNFRSRIVDIVENYNGEGILNCVGDIMKVREFEPLEIDDLKDRTRAYIKIQEGCNRFCSYCMIPYARGPVRSRPIEDIIKEAERLGENGFREIVLTGIHVASYGLDGGNARLTDVLKKVSEIKTIERIRFSSIEPTIVTDEFTDVVSGLDKICHHMHLSLQSGCDRILRLMNRRYTAGEYYNALTKILEMWNDAAISTDIIAGFPGESEEDFEETMKFAEKCGFFKIHAFPFSPKRGTPAADMKPQTESRVKQERVARLMELSEKSNRRFIQNMIGGVYPILFEKINDNGCYEGHTSNYVNVSVISSENIANNIINVKINKILCEGRAMGEIIL